MIKAELLQNDNVKRKSLMRRKVLLSFLILEAAVCILLGLPGIDVAFSYSAIAAFPFEQIGQGLRFLSEANAAGNVAAVTLYVLICLSPVLFGIITRAKKTPVPEDSLLAVLSVVLFVFLYEMVNPAAISNLIPAMYDSDFGKAIMGQLIYSVLLAYLVLRFLRHSKTTDGKHMLTYLTILLGALGAIFVYLAAGPAFGQLVDSLKGTGDIPGMGFTYSGAALAMLFIGFLVQAAPYIFCVIIIFALLNLLELFAKSRYDEAAVLAAQRLSKLSGTLLTVTVLAGMIYNLLQFILMKELQNFNIRVDFPLISIVFILAIRLATQVIHDNHKLQEVNSLFI